MDLRSILRQRNPDLTDTQIDQLLNFFGTIEQEYATAIEAMLKTVALKLDAEADESPYGPNASGLRRAATVLRATAKTARLSDDEGGTRD